MRTPLTDRSGWLVMPLVALAIALLLAGVFWWQVRECRALAPATGSGTLSLRDGTTVRVLRRSLDDKTLFFAYVVKDSRLTPQSCEQGRRIVEALRSDADLERAEEVFLEPTDVRIRLEGWTWRGPLLSCSVSTAIFLSRGPGDTWTADCD